MDEPQLQQLLAGLEPHWLEYLYWSAGIIVAGLAAFALYYANEQICAARDNTKAIFLVELDGRWEGREMREGRTKWRELRTRIYEEVENNHGHLNTDQKQAKCAEVCSIELYKMLKDNPKDYTDILSILGFFETIGYVVDRGFISGEEIAELYGDSIQEFDRLCSNHIEKRREERRNETGKPTDLYEHARNLIFNTRVYYDRTKR